MTRHLRLALCPIARKTESPHYDTTGFAVRSLVFNLAILSRVHPTSEKYQDLLVLGNTCRLSLFSQSHPVSVRNDPTVV
jgi:hypothetical protein